MINEISRLRIFANVTCYLNHWLPCDTSFDTCFLYAKLLVHTIQVLLLILVVRLHLIHVNLYCYHKCIDFHVSNSLVKLLNLNLIGPVTCSHSTEIFKKYSRNIPWKYCKTAKNILKPITNRVERTKTDSGIPLDIWNTHVATYARFLY